MTPEQIELVRTSWSKLRHREEEVAAQCYAELFRSHPHLRVLFAGFEQEQHRKLGSTISMAVDGLDDPRALADELRRLGDGHRTIGVKHHHHKAVSAALLTALSNMTGPSFTKEVRSAWSAFYRFLEQGMNGT